MFGVKHLFVLLTGFMLFACSTSDASHLSQYAVIPKPVSVQKKEGRFVFFPRVRIAVENGRQDSIARQLTTRLQQAAGLTIAVERGTKEDKVLLPGTILFSTDSSLMAEGYTLDITSAHIKITASGNAGFFDAVQTLRLLLPPVIESADVHKGIEWSVPAMQLEDYPRFACRDCMVDVSRCFIPKEEMLRLIDCMGMLKINKLHLHLVDDNRWRLEIKKYPRLTEIGAWRVARDEEFPARENQKQGEKNLVGGFYTQQDVREMVAYAADRAIEIIPEIEMPAHTNSSLAAYPELACPVVDVPITVLPGGGGDHARIIYCAGNDCVFSFFEGVIDEVAALFPCGYIHIGGDEADKYYWKKCPKCQARMRSELLSNEEELQSYFIRRINRYVQRKGKKLMGWDELTNSKLPQDALIFGWRGMSDKAYEAGEAGHPFVMTPARALCLIRYQGSQWFEPRTYFGNNTLADVYGYEPVKDGLCEDIVSRLLGVQGSLWTEFVNNADDAVYLLFPRLSAVAEVAWSDKQQRNWSDYLVRLDPLLCHYDRLGILYASAMFDLDHTVCPDSGLVAVALSCIRPDVEIRCTTDESEPTLNSPLYNALFKLNNSTQVNAATFMTGKQQGKTLSLNLNVNKATARTIQGSNSCLPLLVNGLRGSDKHTDSEWCGWYGTDASFVVDLWKECDIHRVELGTIRNCGMAVTLPGSVTLSVSGDGKSFR